MKDTASFHPVAVTYRYDDDPLERQHYVVFRSLHEFTDGIRGLRLHAAHVVRMARAD